MRTVLTVLTVLAIWLAFNLDPPASHGHPGTGPAAPGIVLAAAAVTPQDIHDRVATLRHDPQFILEAVAQRMGVRLRPEIPVPAIFLESRTPLDRLQASVERQWGFLPHVFVSAYAPAENEIYLVDDADHYRRYGGTPDASLAHELVHYLQAVYRRETLDTEAAESEAVAVQTWFRDEYVARKLNAWRAGPERPAD